MRTKYSSSFEAPSTVQILIDELMALDMYLVSHYVNKRIVFDCTIPDLFMCKYLEDESTIHLSEFKETIECCDKLDSMIKSINSRFVFISKYFSLSEFGSMLNVTKYKLDTSANALVVSKAIRIQSIITDSFIFSTRY